MKWRELTKGLVQAAVLCALLGMATAWAVAHQESESEPELRIHRTLSLVRAAHTDRRGSTSAARVEAICDEGNGVMLYVAFNYYGDESIGIAAVPGGCHKVTSGH